MTINSMPKRILRDMIYPELFSQKLNADVVIFRGTEDKVVRDEWVLDFARFQEAVVHFIRDDHRFSNKLDEIVQSIASDIQMI